MSSYDDYDNDNRDRPEVVKPMSPVKMVGLVFTGLITLFVTVNLLFFSWFTVNEGEVALVTRFSAIERTVHKGFHFKWPFIEGVETFDVRVRKASFELQAATSDLLNARTVVTVNWRLKLENVQDMYRDYGDLELFQENVLNPRVSSAAKAAISKFTATTLIQKRTEAGETVATFLGALTKGLPIVILQAQIPQIQLPDSFMAAVREKQEREQAVETSIYNLAIQKQEAEKIVQSAEAEKTAAELKADGRAYAIAAEATAQAGAIKSIGDAEAAVLVAKAEALSDNPKLIPYETAIRWDGVLPRMTLGGNMPIILNPDISLN